jgi:predicted alpha/beta hydrolase family esterase
MKDQILHIGGGLSFKDIDQAKEYYQNTFDIEFKPGKSWKDWLAWTLEDKYEFLEMKRPDGGNTNYEIWKTVFEKYLAKINSAELTVVCHSLGTIFFMKYLTENKFLKKIKQIHFVAPIVANEFQFENDPENTGSFTFDFSKVSELPKFAKEIHIWHSTDDAMCSFKNSEFLKSQIPEATLHTFYDRGHFIQSTFLELFDVLRK